MTSKWWQIGTGQVDILKILFQMCCVFEYVLNDTKPIHRRISYGKIYLAVDINAFVYSVASLLKYALFTTPQHHPLPVDNPEIIDLWPAFLNITRLPTSVILRGFTLTLKLQ